MLGGTVPMTRTPSDGLEALELIVDVAAAYGSRHPRTLSERLVLAHLTAGAGQSDEGLRLADAVVTDATAALGADHPVTVKARSRVAALVDCAETRSEPAHQQGDTSLASREAADLVSDGGPATPARDTYPPTHAETGPTTSPHEPPSTASHSGTNSSPSAQ
jgi:hypothetical protein